MFISVLTPEMEKRMEKTIGTRIRECRKEIGMSQEELASRMYMDKRTISAYENDKIDIKVSVLKEIALIIGVKAAYLIEGNSDEENFDVLQLTMLLEGMDPELRKVALEQVRALSRLVNM